MPSCWWPCVRVAVGLQAASGRRLRRRLVRDLKRRRQPPQDDEESDLEKAGSRRRRVQASRPTMQPPATSAASKGADPSFVPPLALCCRALASCNGLARSICTCACIYCFFHGPTSWLIWVQPYYTQRNLFSCNAMIYCNKGN